MINRQNLRKDRCWICGLYMKKTYLPYICYWCAPAEVKGREEGYFSYELLCDLVAEGETQLKNGMLVNCEEIPELSLMADFGELGSQHPYIKQFIKMIASITIETARNGIYNFSKLFKIAIGRTHLDKYYRIIDCLSFMSEVGFLENRPQEKYIWKRYSPAELLKMVAPAVEADSNVNIDKPSRIASCISGFALLKGIKFAIDWLLDETRDKEGLLKLYPKDRYGNLMIPKSFTAPTICLLGYIATRENFSQSDIYAWLSSHEIAGKDAEPIIGWLARLIPANHRLVDMRRNSFDTYFNINQNYIRMRNRFRERRRKR